MQAEDILVDGVLVYANLSVARKDYHDNTFRGATNLLISIIFILNIRLARQAIRFIYILNVIQSTVGLVAAIAATLHELWPPLIPCIVLGRLNNTVILIGVPTIMAILFIKSYLGTARPIWMIPLGAITLIAEIAVSFMGYFALDIYAHPGSHSRCPSKIASYLAIAKVIIDTSGNLILSGCFSLFLYHEYRRRKIQLYTSLIRDGIGYAIGAILSNLCCALIILVIYDARSWLMHIYGLDCKY
jgi:hypothetical protein